MAAVSALTLQANADRSLSVTFTSAAKADVLTFAALSALLPASAANSAIKAFLDATRGSVAATVAAISANGVMTSYVSTVADSGAPQVSADKTFAGFAAGDCSLRIALAASISA
jgi:hypothetical protein